MARSDPSQQPVSLEREREKVIEQLSQHFAVDNLSLEELERRMELVYQASTIQSLRELTRDLPSAEPDKSPVPARRPAPVPAAFLPEEGRIVSVMAQTKRKGMWQPPRNLDLWCVMSETLLDMTEAQLAQGVTEIEIHALMAQVKIIVPPGVRVVCQPSAFMAEVADETSNPPAVGSGAPVIRITGPVIMTELKVYVRTRERLLADDGELTDL
jgi:hypothetical protein